MGGGGGGMPDLGAMANMYGALARQCTCQARRWTEHSHPRCGHCRGVQQGKESGGDEPGPREPHPVGNWRRRHPAGRHGGSPRRMSAFVHK